ncbi:uncharacterized protein LOC119397663 [Rhipicephalus sanguineus]|uniref:uncharacterized protein LOC119397663 n=1 Tax=Rhipicephalus sanguineus TaxID=34632 RepID=UPI00189423E1|nr:uncharacterized protein LOC119397663 [Rhipicephalus sanguineus]
MATHGLPNRLPEFNGSSWSSWFGRLQFYFEANNITDAAVKRANLLTLCGEQTYDTVCALIQPRTPATVDYDDIVAALQEHYDPRPSEVYCRARFQRRDQLEGEKVAEYVAALKKLAADCNFGTLTATTSAAAQEGGSTATPANTTMLPLDVMLRDRFVCGLRDEGLQQRLFAETGLTFSKAYNIAQRAESAGHQQRDIRRNVEPVHHTSEQSGHSTSKAKSSKKTQRCWRCDDMHDPQVEVDSGAACTLISEDTFRATWRENAPALQQDDTQLRTWSGHSLPLLGCANVDVYYNGQTHQLPLLVVHGSGSSLLGRNWFTPLGVVVGGVHHTPSYPSVEELQQKYKAVFSEEIPGNNGPPVTLELREDATPKFLKARSVPFALQTSVENELDRLQKQEIIEPTQHSEWATPLVVVRKKNGTLRLCGDYRSTVNLATKASSYPLPTPEEVFSTLRGGKIFSTLDLTQAYQQLKVRFLREELTRRMAAVAVKAPVIPPEHVNVDRSKPVPQTLSPRMTRWCIKMSSYDYELVHRTGKKHQNADALSRLPLDTTIDEPPPPGDILMFEALPNPPLTADTVAAQRRSALS